MAGINRIFCILKEVLIGEEAEDVYRRQLEIYKNQLNIMRERLDTYRGFRHDMQFHMALLADYIAQNEKEKALNYIEEINGYIGKRIQYVDTGNVCVDSIINYELREIYQMGGTVNLDILIPKELSINDFDMNVILSNLLSNACEAMQKSSHKVLDIVMRFDRGVLKIMTVNSYNGVVKEENGQLLSTKTEAERRGVGLHNVELVARKYRGDITTFYAKEEFCVTVLLYLQ